MTVSLATTPDTHGHIKCHSTL